MKVKSRINMTSQYLVVKYLGSFLPDKNVLITITFFIRKQDEYQESLGILFLDKNTMKETSNELQKQPPEVFCKKSCS